MLSNALWNQEALNFIFIDGTIFMANNMGLRQVFMAELYDLIIERLRSENIQLPFRLFSLRIDQMTQHGFKECS